MPLEDDLYEALSHRSIRPRSSRCLQGPTTNEKTTLSTRWRRLPCTSEERPPHEAAPLGHSVRSKV
jgi:hypothetical protein